MHCVLEGSTSVRFSSDELMLNKSLLLIALIELLLNKSYYHLPVKRPG